MADFTLVIGNRNYSSWSLRPWFFMKHSGLAFREIRIPLDQPGTKAEIAKYSPSGRVPVLLAGALTVWDSLAICEYVAEAKALPGWPDNPEDRAVARSVSAEMHSGFAALRSELPMNCRARRKLRWSPAVAADIARILAIWEACRSGHVGRGPWLFGRFSIADAMFAPVVFRFQTYGVGLGGAAAEYASTVLADPAILEWEAAARSENETNPAGEVGTPAD